MPALETDTPFEPSAAHQQRIRERAYRLWEQDGRPAGHEQEYWERARELDAIATNPPAGQPNPMTAHPERTPGAEPVEQAVLQENLGEFPTRFTDQGDTMPTPESRDIARQFRDGER
jgi:hypothetical protein